MVACLQNEMVFTDIITLSLNGAIPEGPEDAQQEITGNASFTQHVIYSRKKMNV